MWGKGFDYPIIEEEPPCPVEVYGRSKWEGEKILLSYDDFYTTIIRCPTIMDEGRLGLLSILFEFINEGKKVWVVGGGNNSYQFIYAQDLVEACIKSLSTNKTSVYNIGSDNVKPFKYVYQYVIDRAATGSRVASLPRNLTIAAMQLCYALHLSPLGPYHYKMIAENFVFNTSKIKKELDWSPTLTNEEMLWKAYNFYVINKRKYNIVDNISAHKRPAEMGIIRLLKWIS